MTQAWEWRENLIEKLIETLKFTCVAAEYSVNEACINRINFPIEMYGRCDQCICFLVQIKMKLV